MWCEEEKSSNLQENVNYSNNTGTTVAVIPNQYGAILDSDANNFRRIGFVIKNGETIHINDCSGTINLSDYKPVDIYKVLAEKLQAQKKQTQENLAEDLGFVSYPALDRLPAGEPEKLEKSIVCIDGHYVYDHNYHNQESTTDDKEFGFLLDGCQTTFDIQFKAFIPTYKEGLYDLNTYVFVMSNGEIIPYWDKVGLDTPRPIGKIVWECKHLDDDRVLVFCNVARKENVKDYQLECEYVLEDKIAKIFDSFVDAKDWIDEHNQALAKKILNKNRISGSCNEKNT